MTSGGVADYFQAIARLGKAIEASDLAGRPLGLDAAARWVQDTAQRAHRDGNKLMFIGNGGSAAIASHCAIDYSKNGNIRAMAFNDGAALTCLGNDLGFENVFAKQIELQARTGDLLIAISSSGNSPDIRLGIEAARRAGCGIVTLSGFTPTNAIRGMGDANFYVGIKEYGFVEIVHMALCHAILDIAMGLDVEVALNASLQGSGGTTQWQA